MQLCEDTIGKDEVLDALQASESVPEDLRCPRAK
jgi:hypothetical protein